VNRAARAEKGASHQIQENQVEFLPGLPNFGGWHLFLIGTVAMKIVIAIGIECLA
jgi:hypothetical protein